jgi:molecular chaperone DnaK
MHGLPPSPRGVPEIEVTFEIDANGIMHVRAKDLGTGKAQSMRIVSSSGLGDDEIQDMIKNAEVYRAEDKLRRDVAEAKNQLDGLIYNTARSVEEFGDALDPGAKLTLKGAMERAESALEANDLQSITDAHEDLFAAAQELADAIYGGLREDVADMDLDDLEDFADDDLDDDFDLDDGDALQ